MRFALSARFFRAKDRVSALWLEAFYKENAGFPEAVMKRIVEEIRTTMDSRLEDKIKVPKNFPEFIFESITQGMKKQAGRLYD